MNVFPIYFGRGTTTNATYLIGTSGLGIQYAIWRPNRKYTFQNCGRSHLEFRRKLKPLSHFTKIGRNVATLNNNTYAWWPESNMVAAAILKLGKLMLFSQFITNFHQI